MIYTTEQIERIVAPIARLYGLPAVYLFGSYARGTATEKSDIDLLIDTRGTALKGLFALGSLYDDLHNAFNKPVDLVTIGALEQTPQMPSEADFRDNVLRERKLVYAIV